MTVRIVTDSACDLTDDEIRSFGIDVVPLSIRFGDEELIDREQLTVTDLDPSQRPINQHWSWDRILRSIFIKQADTLQGFYFFEDDFTESQHKANFDFY